MWPQLREWEQAFILLLIGFGSFLMRAYRYRINNRQIIIENIIYCIIICLLIIPWLKTMFELSENTSYVLTYFFCQSAKSVIEHFKEVVRSKLNM